MKKVSLKRIVVFRIVGAAIVIVLTVSIFLLGNQVQNIRRGLLTKQLSLEGSLKAAVYQASLQDQLKEHEIDIVRIKHMMPVEDEIGSIISSFEAEAKKVGVTIKVPKVEKEITTDKNGNQLEQTGSTQAILMQISAQGKPTALIEFMHAIEYLPYLLGTASFLFDSDSSSAASGSVIAAPGSRPPGAEEEPIIERRATLKMKVRLTVRIEEGTQ